MMSEAKLSETPREESGPISKLDVNFHDLIRSLPEESALPLLKEAFSRDPYYSQRSEEWLRAHYWAIITHEL
jgi:hypothetical protein